MDLVGQVQTAKACIVGIFATHPEVVVLDVQLEGGMGMDVLKAVPCADPGIASVVFNNNSAAAPALLTH
ncbi:MAG: response regulator transcription factor [Polaromonas sp.]|nr:response regulator transcription factor [Gemmatimonadaceae bacterium]